MINATAPQCFYRLCLNVVLAGLAFVVPLPLSAAITINLTAPAQMNLCDTVVLTNSVVNSGVVLSGLIVTNTLPSEDFSYVTNNTVILLPDGSSRSNAAAEPVMVGGTNLIWDFTTVATPSAVTNLLISEVYYNVTNASREDYQWVELFNPSGLAISITNWSLKDTAPGQVDLLPIISFQPGEFVIIAGSTNAFFSEHPGYTGQVFEVADGMIGSGLNNFGDGVQLLNAAAVPVDKMSYGASIIGFSPSMNIVSNGHSAVRDPANVDSGSRNDWADAPVPMPGEGVVPTGLQPGDKIRIIYQVVSACRTVSGQFFAGAGYVQDGVSASDSYTIFVTVNSGDLNVTKTPLVQTAGGGDIIGWTVMVNNAGFGNAKNVVLSDHMASGLEFVYASVAPVSTTSTLAGTEMRWDASVIPALTNLVPDQSVSVVVSGRVISCTEVYNQADAQWGCATNFLCENTSSNGGTATAGVDLLDRNPRLGGYLSPSATVMVPYCGSNTITLTVTNATGPMIGTAFGIIVSNSLPDGWSISGLGVDSNGVIHLGDIPAGGVTNLPINITPGGGCSYSDVAHPVAFTFNYVDACGHPFGPPVLWTRVRLTDFPSVSVTKVMPDSIAGDAGPIPVSIFLTYSNLVGSEAIQFSDTFPVSTNLTVINISSNGVASGGAITWSNLGLTGSGVYTARFDLAIGDPCGGPAGRIVNRLDAPDFVDCKGCVRSVDGSGEIWRFWVYGGICH